MARMFGYGDTPDPRPFRSMRLAVIGAGSLGSTVGRNWVRAGHEVMFSSRHPARLAGMAARQGPNAHAGTIQEAAAFGEAVLLSVPYEPVPNIARQVGEALAGKILINASNQPFSHAHELAKEAAANGLGPLTQRLFPTARVAIAFSAVDATNIEDSFNREAGRLAVPVAADDPGAMETVVQLVWDAGCVPLVIGDLGSSTRFMRGTRPFRANTTLENLRLSFGMD
jgi:predicted dinucleotide-binding enzyme